MSVQSRPERERVRTSVKSNSAQRANRQLWGQFLQFIIALTTPINDLDIPVVDQNVY